MILIDGFAMHINSVLNIKNNFNSFYDRKSYYENNLQNRPIYYFDTVSFGAKRLSIPVEKRMTDYAVKLLQQNGLKKGQQVYIKGFSYYLPFMEILCREAYKLHSGLVQMDVLEESLERLKQKYNKTQEFDYSADKIDELVKEGALFFEFNDENDPYKQAKVMKVEAKEEYAKKYTKIPLNISKLFKISPKEIFSDVLDLHKGQSVQIFGHREHLPIIKKLMHYLFTKNETEMIDLNISNASQKNMLLYADVEVLDFIPKYKINKANEYLEKDIAQLTLYSPNPRENEGISVERLERASAAISKDFELALANYFITKDLPWAYYYTPTTESSIDAYSELSDDKLKMIAKAYEDACKINRVGHLKEHIANLDYRTEKLNELLEAGYRTFHYVSIDSSTNLPDGKTDFRISMSPKSVFKNAHFDKPKYGHHPICNVPTEEVFTAPLADSSNGKIKVTKPLPLMGQLVSDIEFEFKDGKLINLKASKNEESLMNHIVVNNNADRLGEVAIVAGSPITQMNRVFNNVLLDENAASHLALGAALPDTVIGTAELDDYDKLYNYLVDEKINISSAHTDFMVGAKNIVVTAINDETGDSIEIVRDDKFLL